MSAELNALLDLLAQLSNDELTDFIFLGERELLNAQRGSKNETERAKADAQLRVLQLGRKGIPYDRLGQAGGTQDSLRQLAAKMSSADQRTALQVAKTLQTALKPIEKRRKHRNEATGKVEDVAKGRVEIKYIRIPVYDFDTGLRAVDENGNKLSRGPGPTVGPPKEIPGFGPYLYVRLWATGGGKYRNLSRLKSKYVGLKGLAMHLEELLESHTTGSPERKAIAEEIIDRYDAGTLHQWAKEHYPDSDSDGSEDPDDQSMLGDG